MNETNKNPFQEDESNEPRVKPILPQPMPGPVSPPVPPRRQTSGFFWPIILIGFGVVLLLSNMGIFPPTGWSILWRFWPIALIALGIDVMIGHRSLAGAIVSGVLILVLIGSAIALSIFADRIPAVVQFVSPVQAQEAHLEHPLDNTEHAFVIIDWTSVPGTLEALQDSANLIVADIDYVGDVAFNVNERDNNTTISLDTYQVGVVWGSTSYPPDARWEIGLHPDVVYDLELDSGSGAVVYDLADMQLSRLFVDSGSGSVSIMLPDDGNYDFELDSGSGSVAIDLPDNVGARIVLDSGSGSFTPGSRFALVQGEMGDDGVWESDNYRTADYTIDMRIDQGSGAITIR